MGFLHFHIFCGSVCRPAGTYPIWAGSSLHTFSVLFHLFQARRSFSEHQILHTPRLFIGSTTLVPLDSHVSDVVWLVSMVDILQEWSKF